MTDARGEISRVLSFAANLTLHLNGKLPLDVALTTMPTQWSASAGRVAAVDLVADLRRRGVESIRALILAPGDWQGLMAADPTIIATRHAVGVSDHGDLLCLTQPLGIWTQHLGVDSPASRGATQQELIMLMESITQSLSEKRSLLSLKSPDPLRHCTLPSDYGPAAQRMVSMGIAMLEIESLVNADTLDQDRSAAILRDQVREAARLARRLISSAISPRALEP